MRLNWTRDELLAAIELYCLTPFGRLHSRNPDIVAIAATLGRTPSAVAMECVNFASLDSSIHQEGMANASKLDREVWNEFFGFHNGVPEDRKPVAKGFAEGQRSILEIDPSSRIGGDSYEFKRGRINQDFFRRMMLANYDHKCALTGIDRAELLVAAHIMPWATHATERLNPHNGLCLNSLHDRAFENGLIAINDDGSVLYSTSLPSTTRKKLADITFPKIVLPQRFKPSFDFFAEHRRSRFEP